MEMERLRKIRMDLGLQIKEVAIKLDTSTSNLWSC